MICVCSICMYAWCVSVHACTHWQMCVHTPVLNINYNDGEPFMPALMTGPASGHKEFYSQLCWQASLYRNVLASIFYAPSSTQRKFCIYLDSCFHTIRSLFPNIMQLCACRPGRMKFFWCRSIPTPACFSH